MSKLRYCALLALAVACSLDERTLTYGQGVGSATGHGAAKNDGGETGEGGEDASGEGGGEGNEPSTGGAPTEGGAPAPGAAGMGESAAGGGGSSSGVGGASAGSSGNGGAGGTETGGTSSAGSSGSTTSGGTGGIDPDAGPCGDLDRNSVQDCDETLVENPSFATTADDWSVELGATQAWKNEDARGLSGSGSVSITNTKVGSAGVWSSSGSGQCLVAKSGEMVELGARALIPSGQGQGYGRVGFIIYGNDGCQGTLLTSVTTGTVTEAGAWQGVHGKTKLPPATRSIYVRLVVEKPAPDTSFEVLFDDVLVRKD